VAYRVEFVKSAAKALARLEAKTQKRISNAVDDLCEEPRTHGVIKLEARADYRLKVGDFRVIFTIDDGAKRIIVREVINRREGY
jgi:mRNA interferase RelE/StbE